MSQLEISVSCSATRAVVNCSGRIVAGEPVEGLDRKLRSLLREVGAIELDLSSVTFLDSSGIGMLVRNLLRARSEGKMLRIAALSPAVRKTLETTNLISQFQGEATLSPLKEGLRVLFIHPSAEIRTFVGALLKQRGARVNTCESVYDARLLAIAGETDLMLVPSNDAAASASHGITMLIVDDALFSGAAEEAAEKLVARINAVIPANG